MTSNKIIIAHRGASGYLPEHTLASKAMAYAMGAHYLEQDVVLTRDNVPIVIHDIYLDTVTNVKELFPHRNRRDGRFYAIDFTLNEIKQLQVHERINIDTLKPVYEKRFPVNSVDFKIPTLEEEIQFIHGLNNSTGKNIGIYTEIKAPQFHLHEGKKIANIVMELLNRYGYNQFESNCFVQCFDPHCLEYIRFELHSPIKLIQLLCPSSWKETEGVDYEFFLSKDGLKKISSYANGIGPWYNQLIDIHKESKTFSDKRIVSMAHDFNLLVHPYTFRKDEVPDYASNINELFKIFFVALNVDGVFTDFPDMGITFLQE